MYAPSSTTRHYYFFRISSIKTACLGKLYCTTLLLIKILVDVSKYNEVNKV